MRFLDIKTDYAFKKVFGSENSKEILLDFLNAVLDLREKISDLSIEDPYNVPKLKGMKDTTVDVKATLADKSQVIIEMQILNHDSFESRILYNAAKNYSNQLEKGDDYALLNPVIALTIVNFEMFEFEKYKSSFKLFEKENFTEYKDDIELVFIELPKFKKSLEECDGVEEKWIYFIKNARSLNVVPNNINQALQKAFEIANTASLTKEELELQEKREDFLFIQRSSIEKAKREGREEGIEEGKREGREEGKVLGLQKGIVAMHRCGISQEEIAKNLELSIDEVKRVLQR